MVQYENQFKVLKDFLASHASNVEAIKKRMEDHPDETWRGLSEVSKCCKLDFGSLKIFL